MTEPKPIYNTLSDNDMAKIREATINGEPLSTKQLHELITSQAMTIDRLLGEVGRLKDDMNKYERLINDYQRLVANYRVIVDSYKKDKP